MLHRAVTEMYDTTPSGLPGNDDEGALSAWYVFAMRLLPVIPYGVVSYAAGLSPIRFRDYFRASVPGTVLGILPFVLIGSSGVRVLRQGNVLPLAAALCTAGALVLAARLYRRSRTNLAEPAEEVG